MVFCLAKVLVNLDERSLDKVGLDTFETSIGIFQMSVLEINLMPRYMLNCNNFATDQYLLLQDPAYAGMTV